MREIELNKLRIIIFFLALDGNLSGEKLLAFNTFGKYFSGFKKYKKNIIKECKKYLEELKNKNTGEDEYPVLIHQKIKSIHDDIFFVNVLDNNSYNFSFAGIPDQSQMKCIWCLILLSNLFFSSISETKSIIETLEIKWNIHYMHIIEMENQIEEITYFEHFHALKKPELDKSDLDYINENKVEIMDSDDDDMNIILKYIGILIYNVMTCWYIIIKIVPQQIKLIPFFFNYYFQQKKYIKKTSKTLIYRWIDTYQVVTSQEKLRLVFLFLLSCNKVDEKLYATFDEIGNSFPGFDILRQQVINDSLRVFEGNIMKYDMEKRNIIATKEIVNMSKNEFYHYSSSKSTRTQIKCFWLLILLIYYYNNDTEKSQDILKKLSDKWNIKPDVVLELRDTAEAFKSLKEHKDWLILRRKKYPNKQYFIELTEICRNWKDLNKSIHYLINEHEKDENDEDEYIEDDEMIAVDTVHDWIESEDNEADDELY